MSQRTIFFRGKVYEVPAKAESAQSLLEAAEKYLRSHQFDAASALAAVVDVARAAGREDLIDSLTRTAYESIRANRKPLPREQVVAWLGTEEGQRWMLHRALSEQDPTLTIDAVDEMIATATITTWTDQAVYL